MGFPRCSARLVFVLAPLVAVQVWAAPPAVEPDVVDVVVRVRPGVAQAALDAAPRVAAVLERRQVTGIKPLFEQGFANPALAAQLGLDRYYRVMASPGTDAAALAVELGTIGALIERAEPDAIGGIAVTPNDPDFDLQWALSNSDTPGADVNITDAWETTIGNPSLVLAILDAGMDEHVELLDRMIPGKNVAATPDNDDTSDVCISHGTHVAGIAAAIANNGQGIAGVDWQCRIMPVRVLDGCSGPESYVAEGIVWATDNGADVINMSLQYSTGTTVLHDAVLYAHAQGVVMIAAAGNAGATPVKYPAMWPQTIAAGATNSNGTRWPSSCFGPSLDVMAPGVTIWSLKGADQYQFLTGTSMAAPHVAGIVSLMKSIEPGLAPDEIKQILQLTAVDLGDRGFDEFNGWGQVDGTAALAGLEPMPGDTDADGDVDVDDFLNLLGNWGPCPGACPPSCVTDFDGDCQTGIMDFLILIGHWS